MPKINIKVTLITPDLIEEKTYPALLHSTQKQIIYQEKDKTITKVDLAQAKLQRENEELWMEYSFDESMPTTGYVKIKKLNQKVLLNLNTKKIIKEKKKFEINYQVENQDYKYTLQVI